MRHKSLVVPQCVFERSGRYPETLSSDSLHIRHAGRRLSPHFRYDAGVQGLAFCHKQENQPASHRHPEHDGGGNDHSCCMHWDESPTAVDLAPVCRHDRGRLAGSRPPRRLSQNRLLFEGGHGCRTRTSLPQRSATGRVEHDLGCALRGRTRADLHDLIESGERLQLVSPLRRIVQQR